MSKYIKLGLCSVIFLLLGGLFGCKTSENEKIIKFATNADYPPFEYKVNGELQGFDIDLAKLIAKELGKEAVFADMQFSTILPALQNGQVDAAISTITVTAERKQQFAFSTSYYFDGIAAVFKTAKPIKSKDDLKAKKIACQLGSTMEIWLKKNNFATHLQAMDNNVQTVEALKADHVEVILMDAAQAHIFSQKNPQLSYQFIEHSADGYAVAMPKGSALEADINQAILSLQQKGELTKLEQKWLKGDLP